MRLIRDLSLCILISIQVYAQSLDKHTTPAVIPPSPTVANLMHFEEVPVDYYTGQPEISIPLYSKELNSELTMSFAMQYHTSGIKVSERSGWTGTGWSLTGGGTISRTVRGEPDEANGAGINRGIYFINTFWDYDDPATTAEMKYDFMWNVGGTATAKWDSEYDLYQFNIMGLTGRFIVHKDQYGNLEPRLLTKNQRVKIIPTYNTIDYKITAFTIIDGHGNRYVFGSAGTELMHSTPVSTAKLQHSGDIVVSSMAGYDYYCISAWQLTAITTSDPNEVLVELSYDEVDENYETLPSVAEYEFVNTPTSYLTGPANDPEVQNNEYALMPQRQWSLSTIDVATKKLDEVLFRDNTRLKFVPSGTHPEYKNGTGIVLGAIQVRDAVNTLFKTYSFTYWTTNPDTGQFRLWLDKITESSNSTPAISLDYNFTYYHRDNLSGFSNGDGWGYYPATDFFYETYKTGVLTSIQYPTGGVKEFLFEPNTFSYTGNVLLSTGVTDENNITPIPQGNLYRQYLYGAGVRIGSIIFKDSPTATEEARRVNYYYNEPRIDEINSGTGYLIKMPNTLISSDPFAPSQKSSGSVDAKITETVKGYGYRREYVQDTDVFLQNPDSGFCTSVNVDYKVTTNQYNVQESKGNYVGYKYVRVRENGNGVTVYKYLSGQDSPVKTSTFEFPYLPVRNQDHRRGLLIEKQVYNEDLDLLQLVQNKYDTIRTQIGTSFMVTETPCKWKVFYSNYSNYNNDIVSETDCTLISYGKCGSGTPDPAPFATARISLDAGLTQLTESETMEYDSDGNESATSIFYDYNDENYQVSRKTQQYSENGIVLWNGIVNWYRYIEGSLLTFNSTEQPIIDKMKELNMYDKPIEIETQLTGNKKHMQRFRYKIIDPNQIGLDNVKESRWDTPWDRYTAQYYKYDSAGNPLIMANTSGIYEAYIWGYDKTVPIAKIEGGSAAEIAALLGISETAFYSLNESSASIPNLRTLLPGYRVTTLTYDNMRRITTVTDPMGYTMRYFYDPLGRLDYVKDHNNYMVSKHQYNYRP